LRKSWWVLGPLLLAVAVAVIWTQGGDGSPEHQGLAAETISGPGTELPDGLAVPEGAGLLAPVLTQEQDGGWLAILLVTGDPLPVWSAYVSQLADLFPDQGIDAERAPGCRLDDDGRFGCELALDAPDARTGGTVFTAVSLVNPPDDVTGRYLMVLRSELHPVAVGTDGHPGEHPAWAGGTPPAAKPARQPPRVGQALAPSSTAYDGDQGRYVLLDGSEMLAQWGTGSVTGGFDVLLRVKSGSNPDKVGEGYAEQTAQRDGEFEVSRFEAGDTVVVHYTPPGGAGGYQGSVWVVNGPGERDFIYYSLDND